MRKTFMGAPRSNDISRAIENTEKYTSSAEGLGYRDTVETLTCLISVCLLLLPRRGHRRGLCDVLASGKGLQERQGRSE